MSSETDRHTVQSVVFGLEALKLYVKQNKNKSNPNCYQNLYESKACRYSTQKYRETLQTAKQKEPFSASKNKLAGIWSKNVLECFIKCFKIDFCLPALFKYD